MSRDRRKHLIRMVERVAVGLALLDVVLYLALVRPIWDLAQAKANAYRDARLEALSEEARVHRLEWYQSALPAADQDVKDFLANQVQSKRKSFTRVTRLVEQMAGQSSLTMPKITYKMESERGDLLDRMNLGIEVNGPFADLLNFAHAMETASGDFFVIREFSFDQTEGAGLTLKLSVDLYLTRS